MPASRQRFEELDGEVRLEQHFAAGKGDASAESR